MSYSFIGKRLLRLEHTNTNITTNIDDCSPGWLVFDKTRVPFILDSDCCSTCWVSAIAIPAEGVVVETFEVGDFEELLDNDSRITERDREEYLQESHNILYIKINGVPMITVMQSSHGYYDGNIEIGQEEPID